MAMMKNFIISLFVFCSLCLSLQGASLYDHFKIDGLGFWKGQVPPDKVMLDYFNTMELPAAVVVADYSYNPDPCACIEERTPKMYGDFKVYVSSQLKCYDKTILSTVVEVAKQEIFSKKENAKKLYVKTECGYKVIAVAKYMPRLFSVIATNEGYPAVFPATLKALP
jgi:hypothetical protein